jgi:hypothetical protein
MKNDPAIPTPNLVEMETFSNTPLADDVLGEIKDRGVEQPTKSTELQARLSAMKHEIDRMKESVKLLSSGAREIVSEAPSLAQEELRHRVRANPLSYMTYAVGAAFLIGRYLQR